MLLGLGVAGCTSQFVRDYKGPMPGAHEPSVYAAIVVDTTDGTPLPDVHVRIFQDDIRPEGIPGELVHEAETDEFGVVSFPWLDEYDGCHVVFDAIGYAPCYHFGPPGDRVELRPGRTFHGRLLDPEGEPAAGVRVEFVEGCPHAPALRTTMTDASGRFVLWSIGCDQDGSPDGYLWAPAAGATSWELSPRALPVPGDLLEPIRLDPGVTVTGTVYDAKGAPARGAVVFSTQDERGPKVLTDDDGAFTLVGVDPNAEVRFGPPGARADMERSPLAEPPPPPAPSPRNTVRVRAPDSGFLYFAIGDEGSVDPDEDGRVELTTSLRGPVRIDFRHEESGDGWIVVDVDAQEVEVPPTAFRVPGFLAVPEGISVSALDEGGAWGDQGLTSWRYRAGAQVRLARDGQATSYRRLSGRGPYALRGGSATLEIRTGDAKDALCWVDGERFEPGAVRGLDAGPHTVLAGAPGRVGKVARVVLSEGETKSLDLALRKP